MRRFTCGAPSRQSIGQTRHVIVRFVSGGARGEERSRWIAASLGAAWKLRSSAPRSAATTSAAGHPRRRWIVVVIGQFTHAVDATGGPVPEPGVLAPRPGSPRSVVGLN